MSAIRSKSAKVYLHQKGIKIISLLSPAINTKDNPIFKKSVTLQPYYKIQQDNADSPDTPNPGVS